MHHGPLHYDFRVRDCQRHLSSDALRRVESLSFVKGRDDLVGNHVRPRVAPQGHRAVDERKVRLRVPSDWAPRSPRGFRMGSGLGCDPVTIDIARQPLRDYGWRWMYSRIATFAREYRLSLLRLQKSRIVANSVLPKTVTTRYKQTPRGGGINSGDMNLCGRTSARQ